MPIDVVTRYKGKSLEWAKSAHAIPKNVCLIDWNQALLNSSQAKYSHVICHTVESLFWVFKIKQTKKIFIAHVFLSQLFLKGLIKRAIVKLFRNFLDVKIVIISHAKSTSWKIKNSVVIHNVPQLLSQKPLDYDQPRFVVVGNCIKERAEEAGYENIIKAQRLIPLSIIGHNKDIDGAIIPDSSEDFINAFHQHNVYLYVIESGFDDPYNLAMLEAMYMGMPVVSIRRKGSPIIHGKNGFLVDSIPEIRSYYDLFIKNPNLIAEMGMAAKNTILKDFSEDKFKKLWQRVLEE